MEHLKTIATMAVLSWVAYEAVTTYRTRARGSTLEYMVLSRHVWARARQIGIVRILAANLPVMGLTVAAAIALSSLPVLSWGWWSALGGNGNIAFGSTDQLGDIAGPVIALVMCAVLVVVAPIYVSLEEWAFRRRSEHRSGPARVGAALGFGALHVVAGIPIGAALALTVAGMWFTNRYLKGHGATDHPMRGTTPAADYVTEGGNRQWTGMLDAASYHLVWNVSLVAVFVAATVVTLVSTLIG
jgi:hypothetical protein